MRLRPPHHHPFCLRPRKPLLSMLLPLPQKFAQRVFFSPLTSSCYC
jgi:hypothetical protein